MEHEEKWHANYISNLLLLDMWLIYCEVMGGRVDRLTELATATTEGVEHQIKTQGWWQYVAEAVE
jgi:hypothetical protein